MRAVSLIAQTPKHWPNRPTRSNTSTKYYLLIIKTFKKHWIVCFCQEEFRGKHTAACLKSSAVVILKWRYQCYIKKRERKWCIRELILKLKYLCKWLLSKSYNLKKWNDNDIECIRTNGRCLYGELSSWRRVSGGIHCRTLIPAGVARSHSIKPQSNPTRLAVHVIVLLVVTRCRQLLSIFAPHHGRCGNPDHFSCEGNWRSLGRRLRWKSLHEVRSRLNLPCWTQHYQP